jgi:hypothetical protein
VDTRGYVDSLLARLHRIFDKDPKSALALRIGYDGTALTWRIADETLTTEVTGGTGEDLSIPLAEHTVTSLVAAIAGETGYSVPFVSSDLGSRSALILLDGEGDRAASNGDHLMGYTSLLWALLHPWARALRAAYLDMLEAVKQIYMHLASSDYLDVHGDYYGLMRFPNEADTDYRNRIIAAVLMPRNNNVAIQLALSVHLGVDPDEIWVIDADDTEYGDPLYFDGTWAFDGSKSFNGRTTPGDLWATRAQFSVVIPESVAGSTSRAALVALIDQYKAAGTRVLHIYRGHPLVFDGTWAFDGSERFDGRILQ